MILKWQILLLHSFLHCSICLSPSHVKFVTSVIMITYTCCMLLLICLMKLCHCRTNVLDIIIMLMAHILDIIMTWHVLSSNQLITVLNPYQPVTMRLFSYFFNLVMTEIKLNGDED